MCIYLYNQIGIGFLVRLAAFIGTASIARRAQQSRSFCGLRAPSPCWLCGSAIRVREESPVVLFFAGISGTENISSPSCHLRKRTWGSSQVLMFCCETSSIIILIPNRDSLKMGSAWVRQAFLEVFESLLPSSKKQYFAHCSF